MFKTIYSRILSLLVTSLLLLSACSLTLPTATTTTVFYVRSGGNDSHDCLSVSTACLTLMAAVGKATPGSTVDIGAGTFAVSSSIVVDKNLVLRGAGQTASILSPLLPFPPGNSVLVLHAEDRIQDLTVTGMQGAHSVAIAVDNHGGTTANIVLERVTVRDNGGDGLGISGGIVTINDSIFQGNGIGVANGGDQSLLRASGAIQVSNTTFHLNTVGLFNIGTASVDRSTFTQNGGDINSPAGSSPAIDNEAGPSTGEPGILALSNSTVSQNTGSGLFNQLGARASVSNSSFASNVAGIENDGGSVSIQDSLISGSIHGEGLSLDGSFISPGTPTAGAVDSISRTAILGNDSGLVLHNNAVAMLENVTVSGNNTAGITVYYGQLNMSYSTVAGNGGTGINFIGTGSVTVSNSIVELNQPGQNCSGTVHQTAVNFACNNDPGITATTLGLGALTSGTTAAASVIPLVSGSPAIDAATGECPSVDQRGMHRPAGAHCDVGAFEHQVGEADTYISPTPGPVTLHIVTPTPTAPAAPQLTFLENANCRKGPGSAYDVTTSLVKGKTIDAVGRNTDGSWWQVQLQPGSLCWVGDATVSKSGPVEQLALVQAPPLPETPSKMVNSSVCDAKKLMTLTVNLNWASVSGATGFNLYRNGSLLTSEGSGITAYVDNAPLGVDLTYAVEAVNTFGHSGQATTSVPACK
jgi:hypothetical protein